MATRITKADLHAAYIKVKIALRSAGADTNSWRWNEPVPSVGHRAGIYRERIGESRQTIVTIPYTTAREVDAFLAGAEWAARTIRMSDTLDRATASVGALGNTGVPA